MVTFTATDGTVFTDRQAYRLHEFETQYTFRNKKDGEICTKMPNTLGGQAFDISDCNNADLRVLDNTDMVQVDKCNGCKMFIAASCDSVFVRDYTDCVVTLACKQLRTRDCKNCTFYLYAKTEPIIETSSGMIFAPFNGCYKGHHEAMLRANLIPEHNLWFAVYDFNDEAKTGVNWKIMDEAEEVKVCNPLSDDAPNCCPRVAVGSIALPSAQGDDFVAPTQGGNVATVGSSTTSTGSGMKSFSLNTNMHDAAMATGDLYVAQETEHLKKEKAKNQKATASTTTTAKKASGIGWNPDAFSAPAPAIEKKATKGSSIGWNPDAFGVANERDAGADMNVGATSYEPSKEVQQANKAQKESEAKERYEKCLAFMEKEGVSVEGFVNFLISREEEATKSNVTQPKGNESEEQAIDFSVPPPQPTTTATANQPKKTGVGWTGF